MEAGLEATDYYYPPNLTFPFGSYICVVDIDKGTGEVQVRRFVAVDDCGNIINPMIVEGQIHGGRTQGLAPALYEEIVYDESGQNLSGTLADYLVPTAVESPRWELGKTITPSPHHPLGAKGVGESATVAAPPAIANAVVDALSDRALAGRGTGRSSPWTASCTAGSVAAAPGRQSSGRPWRRSRRGAAV